LPSEYLCIIAASTDSDSVHYDDVTDVGIVGGGIVGLATARELKLRHPDLRVVLFEKVCDCGCIPCPAVDKQWLLALHCSM